MTDTDAEDGLSADRAAVVAVPLCEVSDVEEADDTEVLALVAEVMPDEVPDAADTAAVVVTAEVLSCRLFGASVLC